MVNFISEKKMLLIAVAGSIISPFVEVHILQIITWLVTITAGVLSIFNSIKMIKKNERD